MVPVSDIGVDNWFRLDGEVFCVYGEEHDEDPGDDFEVYVFREDTFMRKSIHRNTLVEPVDVEIVVRPGKPNNN